MTTAERTEGALDVFSPATTAWFSSAFAAPTPAQVGAWRAVSEGDHALVIAPTGSGKTLAAFLWAVDGLLRADREPAPGAPSCRVLYISPLKALAADVERNLRSPLVGIRQAAQRLGIEAHDVTVGMRTGDTPPGERRRLATRPPDILITTPESLFLMLTSAARESLRGVHTVIVDEVHAIAGGKRGAHLALSLERLDAMLPAPAQRVGLSATVRPPEEVGRFLVGARAVEEGGRRLQIVAPPSSKELRIDVQIPVADLADIPEPLLASPGSTPRNEDLLPAEVDLSGDADGPLRVSSRAGGSIWPHVTERVLDLICAHRSTIVFVNSRRGAERLTSQLNEAWAARIGALQAGGRSGGSPGVGAVPSDQYAIGAAWPAQNPGQSGTAAGVDPDAVIARAHHGSVSRVERTRIEDDLKAGRLRSVVATSSLELGIDMGAVDLVVQVGAPPSVASQVQRIGRAGHHVGAVSAGVVLPTHRGDLLAAAITARRGRDGLIEELRIPSTPLDVLAQHIVSMLAMDDWSLPELAALARRATPFTALGERSLNAVLDMLAGRYPSEDFAELRPRIVWDRETDLLTARPGAQRLAATSGGTIPDRGLYGVFLAAGAHGSEAGRTGGRRVGELDEEMVYESRTGDTFTLGASTWRIEEITPDRVLVSPAPGLPGRLPFWRGDSPGRPAELGRALGAMLRDLETAVADHDSERIETLLTGLDPWARQNLLDYLAAQREAVGMIADENTIVIERFRDELGDWRLVIHSPHGARVHGPWALVLAGRLRERLGMDVQAMHADDGIVLRLPDVTDGEDVEWALGARAERDRDCVTRQQHDDGAVSVADLVIDPEEATREVVAALAGSSHLAARFREAAARSLLLPRRRPDKRQPLWQQRQRAAQLLSVASRYPDFPVVLEAVRECLQDDFDVPALTELMRGVTDGRVRVLEVETARPSPFAQSLLFSYVGQFLYDGDAPLAERRAAALELDSGLLAELLAEEASDVADLLDPEAVAAVEAEVGLRRPEARVRDSEGVVDLVRRLGPVTSAEVAERHHSPERAESDLAELVRSRRVIAVRIAGDEQWAVVEDAARLRDGLGVALPTGLPAAMLEPLPDPLTDIVRRHARTHGPFTAESLAARFGLAPGMVAVVLRVLVAEQTLVTGRLRPPAESSPAGEEPVHDVQGSNELGGHGTALDQVSAPDQGTAAREYCDAEVMRRIRRRSLAALRAQVEPVPQRALGVFLPRWQRVGSLRGLDGVLVAIEQLSGARVPASELESRVLPARVVGYQSAMLDELTSAGEVVWMGAGAGSDGRDGTIVLASADAAAVVAQSADSIANGPSGLRARVVEALDGGGLFFRDIVERVGSGSPEAPEPSDVGDALWEAVWAGQITNDTLAPVRALLSGSARAGSSARSTVGRRAPAARRLPRGSLTTAFASTAPGRALSPLSRVSTPPHLAGRWSLARHHVGSAHTVPATRAELAAIALVERNGVVVRGATSNAEAPGGFAAVYRTLARLEESGHVRRGYFVEGLGASQFALPECVDRLRADAAAPRHAVALAATDPANPYGASLPWPTSSGRSQAGAGRGRRAPGATVVMVGGQLVLFAERGGKSVLSFTVEHQEWLADACDELAAHVRRFAMARSVVMRIDGEPALTSSSPARGALMAAGFVATPRGLRLRSDSERSRDA